MVNETRRALLETFQNSSASISGEDLSRRFGISRVAIWKHIKALQDEGYPIESGHRGYRLTGEQDNLSSLDFTSAGDIRFYRELESTMMTARKALEAPEGEAEEFLIVADHQSGGIGRNEKNWNSPSGGIYLSCVLNRSFPLGEAQLMLLRGILAALKTLKAAGIKDPAFRAPGDIMLGKRKIGGVLDEYHVRGSRIQWYALGLGIHINDSLNADADLSADADLNATADLPAMASVAEITGRKVLRKEFVRQFREEWQHCLKDSPDGIRKGLSLFTLTDEKLDEKIEKTGEEK